MRLDPARELRTRIDLIENRLYRGQAPAYTSELVLADVTLDARRRFAHVSGDLSGRYVGALALMEPAQDTPGLADLVARLLETQRPDGRFGDGSLAFTRDAIGPAHTALLGGNGRLLTGLLEYRSARDAPDVLPAAERLGAFLQGILQECTSPEALRRLDDGPFGLLSVTQLIEGFVRLAAALGTDRYLEPARRLTRLIPARRNRHAHGYLTSLRGALLLYEATGEGVHLRQVREAFDGLVSSADYTVYGSVLEYFDPDAARDQGSAHAGLLRLALGLWHATGETRYLDLAERCLLNAFFFNQFSTGDFGHHVVFSAGFQPTPSIGRAWWCCTLEGLRAFRDVIDAIVTTDGGAVKVNLLLDAAQAGEGLSVTVRRYPFTLTIEASDEAERSILLRLPPWLENPAIRVNKMPAVWDIQDGYAHLRRPWRRGDHIELDGAFAARLEMRDGRILAPADVGREPVEAALMYGPWLLGVNEFHEPLFFGEPWEQNTITLPQDLAASLAAGPTEGPLSVPVAHLRLSCEHEGFPGKQSVTLRPISEMTSHAQATVAAWLRFRR